MAYLLVRAPLQFILDFINATCYFGRTLSFFLYICLFLYLYAPFDYIVPILYAFIARAMANKYTYTLQNL